jgi:N-acetylmuramoyl-L-alanine amidase
MLPITDMFLDNYNRPKRPLTDLKAVIIHWTANTALRANAVANRNYFNTKPYIYLRDQYGNLKYDSNGNKIIVYASAHYIVDDKNIIKCIPDNEVGYHVGANTYKPLVYNVIGVPYGTSPNNYTIGIEICVNADSDFPVTRQNTIELTSSLLKKHKLTTKNVFRHFDITGKECPKMMVEDTIWNQFLQEVDQLNQMMDVRVNTPELNVRTGPGTNFPIKRKIYSGDIVQKKAQQGKWYQIGTDEWIHSDYVIVI